jgi:hypothetical protein
LNKGNAYGWDKGDMSGQEFGKQRARMAKEKIEELEIALSENEVGLNKGRN